MTNPANPGAPIDQAWDDSQTEITPSPAIDTTKRTMIGVPIVRPPAKPPASAAAVAPRAAPIAPATPNVPARGSVPSVVPPVEEAAALPPTPPAVPVANVSYDVPIDETAEATVFQPHAPLPVDRPVLARDAAAVLLSRDSAAAVAPPLLATRNTQRRHPRRGRMALSLGSFALAAAAAFAAVWHFAGPSDKRTKPATVAAPAADVPVAKPATAERARPTDVPAAAEPPAADPADDSPPVAAPAVADTPAAHAEAAVAESPSGERAIAVQGDAALAVVQTESKPAVPPKAAAPKVAAPKVAAPKAAAPKAAAPKAAAPKAAAPKPAGPKVRRPKAACSGLDCL